MPHWYSPQGRVHDVQAKKGGQRAPTVRDARKHGYAPGVTDVISIMAAPGLERWKIDQTVKAAWRLREYCTQYGEEAWAAHVIASGKEEAATKAELGTEIHKEIERHYTGKPSAPGSIPALVDESIARMYGRDARISTETPIFSQSPLPYGGTVDLIVDGNDKIVLDIKTKESLSDKMVWDNHLMQGAAYCHALDFTRFANVFVSYDGDVEIIEHTAEQKAHGWRMFTAALSLFYAKNQLENE